MPITVAPMNVKLRIVKVNIGDEKLRKHLESLGFILDASLTILSRNKSGNIIQLCNGRIAIDMDVSKHIFVSW